MQLVQLTVPDLSPGNTKLGKILNWNLPAVETCLGRSINCLKACYAKKRRYKSEAVLRAYELRHQARLQKGWVRGMVKNINRSRTKTVRIHASGDFDTVKYIKRWQRIVQGCPDTVFYFYTRSWRVPRLLPHIKQLAAEPNVFAWFSCDSSMPVPPKVPGIRLAYMSMDDTDAPDYPADLVFRVKHKTVAKRMGEHGCRVCTLEQGIERKVDITCETCGICFSNYSTNKEIRQTANAT